MPPAAPAATTSGQALTNLQQYQGGMATPQSDLQSEESNYGVQGAQQTAQGLQGAINNTTNLINQVVPTVQGNTQNSLVTSSQAGQQEQNAEAPLQSTLSDQTTKYNQAEQNYGDLETKAESAAGADETSQQNQLSYLQNVYNDLYTQEQAATQAQTQQQQFQQQLTEQEREANLSSSGSSNVSNLLNNILGGNGGSSSAAGSAYKNNSNGTAGYDFTDNSGNAVSAAKYASLTGQSIGNVLYEMGQNGDTYAQQAYNAIQKSGNLTPALKSQYSAVFWGT